MAVAMMGTSVMSVAAVGVAVAIVGVAVAIVDVAIVALKTGILNVSAGDDSSTLASLSAGKGSKLFANKFTRSVAVDLSLEDNCQQRSINS